MQLNNQELRLRAIGVKQDKINSSSFIYRFQRRVSFSISWFLTRFFPRIKPNHISLVAIILVLITIILSLTIKYLEPHIVIIGQLLILFISSILDKIDGELARIQHWFSQRGIYYDILYHLFYTLALYSVMGFFFFVVSGYLSTLLLSIFLGFLMLSYKISGKVRHHISFKISLEMHKNDIVDFGRRDSKIRSKFVERIHYLIFMIYDWVWIWYIFLVIIHFYNGLIGEILYISYTLFAIYIVLVELLWYYPRHSLFMKDEV